MIKTICLTVCFAAIISNSALAQLRMVDGQIYRADDPHVWTFFPNLEVDAMAPNGVLEVREFTDSTSDVEVNGLRLGTFNSETVSQRTYGRQFLLLHYQSYFPLTPGCAIGSIRAMCVPVTVQGPKNQTTINSSYSDGEGSANMNTVITEGESEYSAIAYDVGVPYYLPQPILTPAQMAAKKAITESNIMVFVKSSATNGDLVSQYELGERYMNGDGVPQDKVAGQMWLQKAEDGGSIEASNYLQNLSETNAVVATH